MHLESTTSAPEPPVPLAGRCQHCGAPLVRLVTSYKHNRVDAVCSAGWQAPYSPDALPCGARHVDAETRFALTELGRRARLIAWLTEPGPTVAEVEGLASRWPAA
jgi:hypothetical protein